jgi:hypothetical protein
MCWVGRLSCVKNSFGQFDPVRSAAVELFLQQLYRAKAFSVRLYKNLLYFRYESIEHLPLHCLAIQC